MKPNKKKQKSRKVRSKEEKLRAKELKFAAAKDQISERNIFNKYQSALYVLFAIFFISLFLFNYKLIGGNYAFWKFVYLPVTILGIILFTFLRRRTLMHRIQKKGIFESKLEGIWHFFKLIIPLSAFSFGSFSNIIWSNFNDNAILKSKQEVITCPIIEFDRGKNPKIKFVWNEEIEKINTNYDENIIAIQYDDPLDYNVLVTVKKGIWGYYKLVDWEVIEK